MSYPKLPKCEHADAIWMPAVISRWAHHEGLVKQLIPVKFCEACTKLITHEQLIPDYAWNAAIRAMQKQGYPPLSRHLNVIQWERAEAFEKEYADHKTRVFHHEDAPEVPHA